MSDIEIGIELECDECGKSVAKIWRNYHGLRYCSTCYRREFKRGSCPQCGNLSRLPKFNPHAICMCCERKTPCARCKKTDFDIALVTEYGAVCGSCAPYFRKQEPCEICGTPSGRLTRVSRLWHDKKVCPKCASEDHGNCQACSRHRLLSSASDGRLLCKICLTVGVNVCSTCGKSMPAGYGRRCEACYWQEKYVHRCKLSHSALVSEKMGQLFSLYTKWLAQTCGYKKASIVLNRHMTFFLTVDEKWGDMPKFAELLALFGSSLLRKNFLPLRWLIEEKYVEFDVQLKKDAAEWSRIKRVLTTFGLQTKEKIYLYSYYAVLKKKYADGLISPTSIRLALTPVIALLTLVKTKYQSSLDQVALNRYLLVSPGQRAALSGFVGHLWQTYNLPLELPPLNKQVSASIKKKRLEDKMLKLMVAVVDSPDFHKAWITTCLAYFHDVPKKIGVSLVDTAIEFDGGIAVHVDGNLLWIPLPSD